MNVRKKAQMALVLFSVIPLVLSTVIILSVNVQAINRLNIDRIDKLAHISASAFSEIVDLRKEKLLLLPTRADFKSYIQTRAEHGAYADRTRAEQHAVKSFLHEYIESVNAFNDAVVLDENGIVCISDGDRLYSLDLSGLDYFQRVVEANDPGYVFVSRVHKSLLYPDDATQNNLALSLILNAPDGSFQGVLVAFINTDVMAGFIRGISFGETGIAFAIDSDNFILYHPDPRFFNTHTAAPQLQNLLARCKSGEIPHNGLIYDQMDGVMRVYYYAVVGQEELVLLLRQNYSEFTQDRNRTLLITTTTLLTTFVIALYMAVKFSKAFVEPILKLKEAFESGRSEGRYIVCDIGTNDEIGEMAEGYNTMIQTLEHQFEEITEEKIRTEHVALHDYITGLYNRTAFEIILLPSLNLGNPIGVFFLDLDGFKQVNDVMGHAFGDTLLYMLGRRIADSKAHFDVCARIGGDEFLLYKFGTRREIEASAGILMDELRVPFEIEHRTTYTTCSMGIAMYPDDGATVETLVKNADIAMYSSKDRGKNMFTFYNAEMQSYVDRHSNIMSVLRGCIKNGEVSLVYQPEVVVSSEIPAAYEALMRINSKELGPIEPGEFIPIAESDSSLINKLGHWALVEACRFARKLVDETGFGGVVAVNISVSQLHRDDFVDEVLDVLAQENLPARYLQIELTESILMSEMESNVKKLTDLRENGVAIAMDDFGTHYSSFNYLIHLPLDVLKIDRSFFTGIETNERMMQVNKAIVDVAHKLELKVVAEGVETEKQYRLICDIGCDIVQGYYFSQPMPESDILGGVNSVVGRI